MMDQAVTDTGAHALDPESGFVCPVPQAEMIDFRIPDHIADGLQHPVIHPSAAQYGGFHAHVMDVRSRNYLMFT
jgi:hypothetical protein